MRKHFYFAAIVCVLLSVCVLSASAVDLGTAIENLEKAQEDAREIAQNKVIAAHNASSVMGDVGTYYGLHKQKIHEGISLTLGSVLKGAVTITVTWVTGGNTLSATVIASMEPSLRALGLLGSVNTTSDLESAYETAISECSSRVSAANTALTTYAHAWDKYRVAVINHNSQYHGSGSSPSDPAHEESAYNAPELDVDMPSFSCPGGGCNITYSYPSEAREAHFSKCGTADDAYDTNLYGCGIVYYTCNTADDATHKPRDCGLQKWVSGSGGDTLTSCGWKYRNCKQTSFSRPHAISWLSGVNTDSICGPSSDDDDSGSDPPSDGTPNCSDCTSDCSYPCSCTNSGTCGGSNAPDSTPDCMDCSSDCSYPCSCTNSGTCGGSNAPDNTPNCDYCTDGCSSCDPPSDPPDDGDEDEDEDDDSSLDTCSGCDGEYDPESTSAVNLHRLRTCRFSVCGQSWRRCLSSAPLCLKPARQANGQSCWASD